MPIGVMDMSFGTMGRGKKRVEQRGDLVHPARHRNEAKANERRLAYLAQEPARERNVEALLDARQRARAGREEWLRAVLDACED